MKNYVAALIPVIIGEHAIGQRTLEIKIEKVTIIGTITNVGTIGIPIVELLSMESKLDEWIMSPTVIDEFIEAVTNLIEKGIKFETVLRKNWIKPAIHWTLKPSTTKKKKLVASARRKKSCRAVFLLYVKIFVNESE